MKKNSKTNNIDITKVISEDMFIHYMTLLKEDQIRSDKLVETLNNLYGERQGFYVDFYPSSDMQNALLLLLKDLFKDDSDWISYYVFECDFGANKDLVNSITDADGSKIPLNSLKDLYKLLVNNYNEKKDKADDE